MTRRRTDYAVRSLEIRPDDHIQGAEDAPVTLLEYGDYQCPTAAKLIPSSNSFSTRWATRCASFFAIFHSPRSIRTRKTLLRQRKQRTLKESFGRCMTAST